MAILYRIIISLLVLCVSTSAISQHDNNHNVENHDAESHDSKNEKQEVSIVENVLNHISDAHDWHFFSFKGHHYSIPLPVILLTDGNLDVFMSSEFHHGHSEVKKDNRTYTIDKGGKISEASGLSIIDFSITKNVASMFIALIVLILIMSSTARAYKKHKAPKGIQAFIEPIVLFVKDDIVKTNIGSKYKKYLPYLLTLFFFILVNNLLGLLPGAANVTGNIAITIVLSFITLIVTNINGNKAYWGHIFKPPGVPLALMPIMIPIEMVGIITKPFALMIRLFANITAGHIVILSLISLIFMAQSGLGTGGAFGIAPVSVIFVLFMYLIEILVAFLQAYIFTLLTSLFIGLATSDNH